MDPYVMIPCADVCGHAHAMYEVWHDTGHFDFELIEFIDNDCAEVFVVASFQALLYR